MAFDARWDAWHGRREANYPYPETDFTFFIYREFSGVDHGEVKVLDIGCGRGPNTWFLAREGFRVTAVDASVVALECCRRRLEHEGLHAEAYVKSESAALPFADASFHCIVDMMCLYANELPDAIAAVSEARRVLVPGGILYSVWPSPAAGTCHYEDKGEFIFLTEENFQPIFRGFTTANVYVLARRGIADKDPYLEHIVVVATNA